METETEDTAPVATYLEPEQVVEWLRLKGVRRSVQTLRNWRKRDRLKGPPFNDLHGRVLYPVAELEAWWAGIAANGWGGRKRGEKREAKR